jgi:hypothetical protein
MFRSDGERRSFSVTRDMTVIGRREDCDLRIPLSDVSRKHARLVRDGDTLRLEDLGSSNGTYLNGQRVQEAVLIAGDSVQIGPVVFVLQIDGQPAEESLRPITADVAQQAAPAQAPVAVAAPLLPPMHGGGTPETANEFESLEPLALPDAEEDLGALAPLGDEDEMTVAPRARAAEDNAPVELAPLPHGADELAELEPAPLDDMDLAPVEVAESASPTVKIPLAPPKASAPPLPAKAPAMPPAPPPRVSTRVPPPPPAAAVPMAADDLAADDLASIPMTEEVSEPELADLNDFAVAEDHSIAEHPSHAPADAADHSAAELADDTELESRPVSQPAAKAPAMPPPPPPRATSMSAPPAPPLPAARDNAPTDDLDPMLMDEISEPELANLADFAGPDDHSHSEHAPHAAEHPADHAELQPADSHPFAMEGETSSEPAELVSAPHVAPPAVAAHDIHGDDLDSMSMNEVSEPELADLTDFAGLDDHSDSEPPSGLPLADAHTESPSQPAMAAESHAESIPLVDDHSDSHRPAASEHFEPAASHQGEAHAEPEILPHLHDESDLGELPMLADEEDLALLPDEGHSMGVNLDVGADAQHRPHA